MLAGVGASLLLPWNITSKNFLPCLIVDVPQLRPLRIVCRVLFGKVHTTSLGEPLSIINFTFSLSQRVRTPERSPHHRATHSCILPVPVFHPVTLPIITANPHQHPQQQWTNRQVEQEKSSPLERVAIQRVQALKQQSVTGAIPLLQVSSGVALAIDGIEFFL